MREAKFILPLNGGNGDGHNYARQALLKTFGGYSHHPIAGAWIDQQGEVDRDDSIQYVVAMTDNWVKFRAIAMEAARLEQQKAVYIVSPAGGAEIVNLPHHAGRAVPPVPPAPADGYVLTSTAEVEKALGLPDRIVRPDKNNGENLPVQQGDIWETADKSLVRITNRKMSGEAYAAVIESGSFTFATGVSAVYEAHDGNYITIGGDPHPLDLKRLVDRPHKD